MNVNILEAGVWSPFSGRAGEGSSGVVVKGNKSFRIFRFESFSALPPGRFSRSVDFASLLYAPPPPVKRSTKAYPRDGLNTLRFYFFSFKSGVLHGMLWKSFLGVPDDSRDFKTRGGGRGTRRTKKEIRIEEKKWKSRPFIHFFAFFSIQISGSSSSCARLSNDMRNERKFI